MDYKKTKIAVVGLGYVGLPVALAFGKKRDTVGFDINEKRINELNNWNDSSLEFSTEEIKSSNKLSLTYKINDIKDCGIFIVSVPTPIDNEKKPDLTLLKKSCNMVGSVLKKDDLVIFESTVYPGVTEDICVQILENESNLIFNKDFYCGYSPERINPGDKNHRLSQIKKITSGSTPNIALEVDDLYKEIIEAGTYLAQSIKVAEAAKVIENIQRDVNIALINEFSIIFNKLKIDTKSVLEAAETKWNFLPFRPGLVGGHCIGIDPYYLLHCANEIGHKPQMITAGREINNNMSFFIVQSIIDAMKEKKIKVLGSNILIMGFTFKENCTDIRNTRVIDLVNELTKYEAIIDVYDPLADKNEVLESYNLKLIEHPMEGKYDAIIFAVAHDKFKKLQSSKIKKLGKPDSIIYDIKYILDDEISDKRI
jgi:UDP-N-acetyl-D-galactosamine dehydrogenase